MKRDVYELRLVWVTPGHRHRQRSKTGKGEAAAIKEAKYKTKWSNTTIGKFARQASGRENSCSEEMRQVGLKIRAS
nr:hypothetical protein [Tanacetum cinerariifolium]